MSVLCAERRRWSAVSGIAARDCAEPGDDDPRRSDQSGSRAHAGVDTSQSIGVEGGAVPEGEELAQVALGICLTAEAILGPAFVGARILGCFKRQRHRRHVAEIYRGSKTRDAGRPFQGCVAVDLKDRPNPASSRNLKPPALAGVRSQPTRSIDENRNQTNGHCSRGERANGFCVGSCGRFLMQVRLP